LFDDRNEGAQIAGGGRYYLIQCLRFFAASFVVAYHSVVYVSTHGGALSSDAAYYVGELSQLGILIFFAISGFVITHAIQRRSSAEFLWLRALRIYPGFWIASALAVLLHFVVFGHYAWSERLAKAMTLLPLGVMPGPLGGVEWTLIYEVFFYLLIALLWLTRSNRVVAGFCALWAAAIVAVAVLRPSWGAGLDPTFARIGSSAYNLAFIAGVFAYFVHRRLDLGAARMLAVLVPGFAIAGEFFALTEWKLACVALASFCLVAAVARFALTRDAARDALLTQWGDASYGLYLLHNTVIVVIFNSVIGVRQVHWAVGMAGLFGLGMGLGLLYGALEHRLYGALKAHIGRSPWKSAASARQPTSAEVR
jgi:peptidoglycan/LPS O-acetylase OafA/YrhL